MSLYIIQKHNGKRWVTKEAFEKDNYQAALDIFNDYLDKDDNFRMQVWDCSMTFYNYEGAGRVNG